MKFLKPFSRHTTLGLLVIWSVLPFAWAIQSSLKFTRDVARKEPVLWGYETTSSAYNKFWLDDDEINMLHVLIFILTFVALAALIGYVGKLIAAPAAERSGRGLVAALVAAGAFFIWKLLPIATEPRTANNNNALVVLVVLGIVLLFIAVLLIRNGPSRLTTVLGTGVLGFILVCLARVVQIYLSERDQWSLWETESSLWGPVGVVLTVLAFVVGPVLLGVAMLRNHDQSWPWFVSVGLLLAMALWWFPRVFDVDDKFDYFVNSIIVTVLTMLISISIGVLAGYALARYSGVSGAVILIVALAFRALPRTAFVLPYYFAAQKLGILDSRLVIVMALVAVNQPFTIWMFRTFFMDVPKEMEEAAMMDGATRFEAFRKVIIPIMWPGIIATSLFTLLLAYNEFLFVRVLAPTNWTLPVAIVSLTAGESSRALTEAAAASVSITLPIVVVIILFQKHLVKGLGAGAVKG